MFDDIASRKHRERENARENSEWVAHSKFVFHVYGDYGWGNRKGRLWSFYNVYNYK